jgi:uncharacterized protein (DUF2267 family)
MTVPVEYQRARDDFYTFLVDVRDSAGLGSTHQAFTTSEGVLHAFRMRLSLTDAIRFAGVLPAGLRALFVSHWDPEVDPIPFGDHADQLRDVRSLRADHNFSPDDAIKIVAAALRRAVDAGRLDAVLAKLPREAAEYWRT